MSIVSFLSSHWCFQVQNDILKFIIFPSYVSQLTIIIWYGPYHMPISYGHIIWPIWYGYHFPKTLDWIRIKYLFPFFSISEVNLNSKIKWLYNQSFCIETLFNIKGATRTKINPKTTSFKFSVDPNLRNLRNNSILFKSKGTHRFQMTSIFLCQKACLHRKASFCFGVEKKFKV